MPGVTSFVCSMYGFTTSDINEAMYKAFIRMSGGDEKYPLATIKKSNCMSPTMQQNAWQPRQKCTGCFDELGREPIRRIQLARQDPPNTDGKRTTTAWSHADRFPGRSVLETLGATRRDDATTRMDDAASHIGDVSTHADDERTERMTLMTTLTTWKWWRQHPRTTNSRVPGERTAMTVPTKIRRATFEDVKTYKHTSIKQTKSQKV